MLKKHSLIYETEINVGWLDNWIDWSDCGARVGGPSVICWDELQKFDTNW